MTPAEHYAETETLIGLAQSEMLANSDEITQAVRWNVSTMIALAQAHATLAACDPERLWPLLGVVSYACGLCEQLFGSWGEVHEHQKLQHGGRWSITQEHPDA